MSDGAASPDGLRRLIRTLAVHPVLPPAEALPPNDETFRALVADLARGAGSTHRELLREVADEVVISVRELAQRAEFLLACLVLPAAGTHYEVLGLERNAAAHEIRRRWAELMQRYHPDHFGGGDGGGGWLDAQARRLIEAYQTLKDPERRRRYDAELSSPAPREAPGATRALRETSRPRLRGRLSWRWAPAGILAVGAVAGGWAVTHPPGRPLPSAPLPADPRLLESWATGQARTAGAVPGRAAAPGAAESAGPVDKRESPVEPSVPTDRGPATPALRTHDGGRGEPTTSRPQTVVHPRAAGPASSPTGAVATAPPLRPASPGAPSPAAVPATQSEEPGRVAASPGPSLPGGISSSKSGQPVEGRRDENVSHEDPLAMVEAFRGAYERKDLHAVMALLGTDIRERKTTGRVAVEKMYATNFALLDGIRYELSQVELGKDDAGPDELIVRARFRIRAARVGLSSSAVDVAGPIRWVLRREAGMLRIMAIDYEVVGQ